MLNCGKVPPQSSKMGSLQWKVSVAPEVYEGSGPLDALDWRVADRVSMASRQGKAMAGLEAAPERRGADVDNDRTQTWRRVVGIGARGGLFKQRIVEVECDCEVEERDRAAVERRWALMMKGCAAYADFYTSIADCVVPVARYRGRVKTEVLQERLSGIGEAQLWSSRVEDGEAL